jgi:DNA-binding NarL/FixJ family response regulator
MNAPNATLAKILIVDDHPMIREGLALRIGAQADMEVCGEAASEEEAIALVKRTRPDLMIVDISLKDGNGIDVIKRVKMGFPNVRMLVVSGYQEALYGERALRAGAMGYLNKQESNDKVLEAVRAILAGQRYVSPDLTQKLVNQALGYAEDAKSPIDRLSNRELDVFRMIGEGLSSGTIADRLFLSTHTIDTHRENIKRKLNIKSAGELTRQAVQWVLQNTQSS